MSTRQQSSSTVDLWLITAARLQSLLRENLQDAELSSAVGAYMRRLHRYLLDSADSYRQAVHAVGANSSPQEENTWSWHPLVENARLRSGLLSTFENQPVPMHDHPGSNGVLLVVKGKVAVKRFCIEKLQQNSMARLKQTARDTLREGQVSIVGGESGEIHTLESVLPHSIMLDVITPPYAEQDRYWYFPVSKTENDIVLARRIRIARTKENVFVDISTSSLHGGTQIKPGRTHT